MEEEVRKELFELCENILNDAKSSGLENHLTNVQMLYEKLLILNYLKARHSERRSGISPERGAPVAETPSATPFRTGEGLSAEKAPAEEEERQAEKPAPQEGVRSLYQTPEFVEKKPGPEAEEPPVNESPVVEKELKDDKTPEEQKQAKVHNPVQPFSPVSRSSSLNERYGSGAIRLGLNDRIAFVNHLFDGNQEDLNRVLSQLNTFETLEEAESFVRNMIKPEYNWSEKEEFEERFLAVVRKRFGE